MFIVLKLRNCVAERLRAISPAAVHVCAITLAEAGVGALRSADPERRIAAWDLLLQPFEDRILPFDKDAAEAYGKIRAQLEQGKMIGDRDCMIAAIARSRELTVVTANLDEFRRVPGMVVEDWRRA